MSEVQVAVEIARGTRSQVEEVAGAWNDGDGSDFGPATIRFLAGLGWVATATRWA